MFYRTCNFVYHIALMKLKFFFIATESFIQGDKQLNAITVLNAVYSAYRPVLLLSITKE